MPMTGAERVARLINELVDVQDRYEAAVKVLQELQPLREEHAELRRNFHDVSAKYNELVTRLGDRGDIGPTPDEWDTLDGYTPSELEAWVKVGRAMKAKGHDAPVSNAMKWVEGNRVR